MKPPKDRFTLSSRLLVVPLILILPLFGFVLPYAQAATFTVSTTADSGPGSLRQAITDANTLAGDDLIDFSVTGTITLLSVLPPMSSNITINGPGANLLTVQRSTASGTAAFRIFNISSGATAAISGLTITKGTQGGIFNTGTTTVSNCTISANSALEGGGIVNGHTLTVNNCILSGNTATDTLGRGGAIYNGSDATVTINDSLISDNIAPGQGGGFYNTPTSTLIVNNCTLAHNHAHFGGAIGNSGSLTITNGTLSGNSASNAAGGIFNFSGGALTLISSTITGNSAVTGVGGIYNSSGTMNIGNSIIAGNSAPTKPDVAGTITSLDYNLIQDTSGAAITGTTTHNITGVSPNLGPLQNNGGPTPTHALLNGSPAIDAGSCSAGSPPITTDQRGNARPVDVSGVANAADGCDIGAFEFDPAQTQSGSTLVVNTTDDLNDSACTFGHCSLREAIDVANTHANGATPDTISFNIQPAGPKSIAVGSALPEITQPVVLDGTTQPGFSAGTPVPIIEINGAGAGAGVNGLTISGGGSTVRGLVINRFSNYGIELKTIGGNLIAGNGIGVDLTGQTDLGNGLSGILINHVPDNVIGGTGGSGADLNLISGNNASGIEIVGSTATRNLIHGNIIGTNLQGTLDRGNSFHGIFLNDAPGNTIGTDAAANLISGNDLHGVNISGSGATGNIVQHFHIGLDGAGFTALGNGQAGIFIQAPNTIIGSTTAGVHNAISGNTQGIVFSGSVASGNIVRNTVIGTDRNGAGSIPNTVFGIAIDSGSNNTIGGSDLRQANVIANNGFDGVAIFGGTGNRIRANSIHSNGGMGIDLGPDGPTANDASDSDSGANNLQNFPVITSAINTVGGGSALTITFTLSSTASTSHIVDFFASTSADASGHGEGQIYLGSRSGTTNGSGLMGGSFSVAGDWRNRFITATATDAGGNTSEFSQSLQVVNQPPINVSLAPANSSRVVGVSNTYTSKYSDPNGIPDLAEARILINSSLNGANALHGMYVLATNKLYLRDNVNGSWLGGFAPLSNNVISNSQGSLNCALTTVGGNGNTLTVNWSFTPAATWTGGRYIYMQVRDKSNAVDGFEQMGTVQLVANKAPINQSVTPNSGSSAAGVARTLTAKYFDENLTSDIAEARILVNSAPTGAGALLAMYTPANNKLFLRDNVNGSWLGGFAPGSANVITNGQGSLNCAATTVTFGAQILTINWSLTPAASFTGTKNLYLLVRDRSNAVDGLDQLGAWTITGAAPSTGERAASVGAASPVVLSSGATNARSQSVLLTFSGALDAAIAGDAARYEVQVNGQMVPVVSAAYRAGTNAVTLSLAPGTLRAGDKIVAFWTNLQDAKGAALSDQTGTLIAQ